MALEGCFNLRDLGGHLTQGGRAVRRGCVFRSDELCRLTEADLAWLHQVGIRVVFDLRNQFERAARPSRLWDGVEVLERKSPATGSGPGPSLEDQIVSRQIPEPDDERMANVYIELLGRLAPELRVILTRAAEAAERPLLIHCVAGKDRTGLAAAVLLGVLGVPGDKILDEYELTTSLAAPRRLTALRPLLETHSVPEERVRPLLEVRRRVLASALEHLEQRWGGFEGYVAEGLGLDDLPVRLRQTLLL